MYKLLIKNNDADLQRSQTLPVQPLVEPANPHVSQLIDSNGRTDDLRQVQRLRPFTHQTNLLR